ncbi:hypothetical protein K491DRAFT_713364 [Lophiostoma macrostomum CBS 122681]|uniref:Uncharacterized protein n=1 Tax=Lophiostoma macrostomum CBS 122681 TaxID=1314788 RepID=A0A6A6TFH5_9PLEO|nr:hypothetical protein K491DRAFT_713364 [Lophiostoma macrostomum CBS 122681]
MKTTGLFELDTELVLELFNAIGSPVRLYARILFIARYLFTGFTHTRKVADYATSRYGDRYYWRPWLLFDIEQLEQLEYLINDASDTDLLHHKRSQEESMRMISIVGALIAFALVFAFALFILGMLLGGKEEERQRMERTLETQEALDNVTSRDAPGSEQKN